MRGESGGKLKMGGETEQEGHAKPQRERERGGKI